MITNIYKNESNIECVDICEVLYNILNQFYNFNQIIQVKEIKDIKKISNTSDFKQVIYVNIAEYKGSARTALRRLNIEAFLNINTTIVTIIPTRLLKFLSENCMNVSIEHIPSTVKLDDIEIEIEENLAIVIFNPTNSKEGEEYEC
ncbi:hypothetical protein GSQ54_20065 [Clostridioides difficile]|nr:hypothetical protein [Clostridioides difficile]